MKNYAGIASARRAALATVWAFGAAVIGEQINKQHDERTRRQHREQDQNDQHHDATAFDGDHKPAPTISSTVMIVSGLGAPCSIETTRTRRKDG